MSRCLCACARCQRGGGRDDDVGLCVCVRARARPRRSLAWGGRAFCHGGAGPAWPGAGGGGSRPAAVSGALARRCGVPGPSWRLRDRPAAEPALKPGLAGTRGAGLAGGRGRRLFPACFAVLRQMIPPGWDPRPAGRCHFVPVQPPPVPRAPVPSAPAFPSPDAPALAGWAPVGCAKVPAGEGLAAKDAIGLACPGLFFNVF